MTEKSRKLPILPLRDQRLIVFPGLPSIIDVGRQFSIDAVDMAKANNTNIIIAMQRSEKVTDPVAADFYGICTEAEIKNVVPLDDEGIKKRVIVMGISRARLKTVGFVAKDDKTYLCGEMLPYEEEEVEIDDVIKTYISGVIKVVEENFTHVVIKNKDIPETTKKLSIFIYQLLFCICIPVSHKFKIVFKYSMCYSNIHNCIFYKDTKYLLKYALLYFSRHFNPPF